MKEIYVCDQSKLVNPAVERVYYKIVKLVLNNHKGVPRGENKAIPSVLFTHYGDYANDGKDARTTFELRCEHLGIQQFWVSTQPRTCTQVGRPVVQRELPSAASYLHLNWSAAIKKWLELLESSYGPMAAFPVDILARRLNIGAALLPVHTLLKGCLLSGENGTDKLEETKDMVKRLFAEMQRVCGYRIFVLESDWVIEQLNPVPNERIRLIGILNSNASLTASKVISPPMLPRKDTSQGALRLLWEASEGRRDLKPQHLRAICELALAEIEFVMSTEAFHNNLQSSL